MSQLFPTEKADCDPIRPAMIVVLVSYSPPAWNKLVDDYKRDVTWSVQHGNRDTILSDAADTRHGDHPVLRWGGGS